MWGLTFEQFQLLRISMLRQEPSLLDLTETRMAHVLAPWTAHADEGWMPAQGHRCHVAQTWLECFCLPAQWKPRALVTQGVRASLKVLFEHAKSQGLSIALPQDVYPVYASLARDAGLEAAATPRYPTMGLATLSTALRACPQALEADWLLVTSPCKPCGIEMSSSDVDMLLPWLAQKATRRVLIDAVYAFEPLMKGPVQTLVASEQATYLHSLSKGWAAPLRAGVMLVPPQDVEMLTPRVRSLTAGKPSLRLAQGLLQSDRARPLVLGGVLDHLRKSLTQTLRAKGLGAELTRYVEAAPSPVLGQYLFVVPRDWRKLFHEYAVLALPASIFGSSREDLSVVSSLAFAPHFRASAERVPLDKGPSGTLSIP